MEPASQPMVLFERLARHLIAPAVRRGCLAWAFVLCATAASLAAETNLVFNGSFDANPTNAGTPDGWSAAGNPAVKQRLILDPGRDGRHCAKLECTEFLGDGPDYHAMICQVGKVGVVKDLPKDALGE